MMSAMDKEDFEKLSTEEQVKAFKQGSLAEKGYLFRYTNEPEKIAGALSQEEFYLMTRDMDLEDRAEVLRYATLPQLIFMADLDCWKADRLHPPAFLAWLETLEQADERRLFAWLTETDYEAVVAGFKGLISVVKPDWEYAADEILGDQPYFTLDQRYFILVSEENMATVRRAIELLFEHHRGRYTSLLEGMLAELDDMVEEEAYQNREKRLADRGFPSLESARMVYRPMTLKDFHDFPLKTQLQKKEPALAQHMIPDYVALWSQENFFLDQVLMLLKNENEAVLEGLHEELAWLSNKLIACEGIDFTSEEKVVHGIERARKGVSLGLEILSGGNIQTARDLILTHWLESIFRHAVWHLAEMRDRCRDIVHRYWNGNGPGLIDFLGLPYQKIIQPLLALYPCYYDPQEKKDEEQIRDFKSLHEIQQTSRAVAQIESIHQWLDQTFKHIFQDVEKAKEENENELTLGVLLATVFAAATVRKQISFKPLSLDEVEKFFKTVMGPIKDRRLIPAAIKETFLSSHFSENERDILRPLWGWVFQQIEEELSDLPDSKNIDWRFMDVFRVNLEVASSKKSAHKSRRRKV